jgi:hypothetical protein
MSVCLASIFRGANEEAKQGVAMLVMHLSMSVTVLTSLGVQVSAAVLQKNVRLQRGEVTAWSFFAG